MTLVLLDLETTGLDPARGYIMEAAVLVVDEQLVEVASRSLVVDALDDYAAEPLGHELTADTDAAPSWAELFAASNVTASAAADVMRMHEVNGLMAEIDGLRPGGVQMAEEALLDFLTPIMGSAPDFGPLVGNGVSRFDRAWLVRHMPRLAERFSYRDLDTRSLWLTAERFADFGGAPEADRTHRALPDCHDALAFLRWYRKRFLTNA